MIVRLVVFCVAGLAVPVGIHVSNRIEIPAGPNFLRALTRAESGIVVTLLAFLWGS